MARCGLCLQDRVLRRSHLMPKSLYRVLRSARPGAGKDLVLSSMEEGSSVYTDNQVVTPFLCDACEGILSSRGEQTVCRECYRGHGKFTLRDKVRKATDSFAVGDVRWINPIRDSTNLNSDAYLHFGASVIWRASAGKWPESIGRARGALGRKYQEELRRYLLGETGFPSKIYLGVFVDGDEDIMPIMAFPTHTRYSGHYGHDFYIPGVKFRFTVGSVTGGIGREFKQAGTPILFADYSFRKSGDFQLLAANTRTGVTPRGRLAKDVASRVATDRAREA